MIRAAMMVGPVVLLLVQACVGEGTFVAATDGGAKGVDGSAVVADGGGGGGGTGGDGGDVFAADSAAPKDAGGSAEDAAGAADTAKMDVTQGSDTTTDSGAVADVADGAETLDTGSDGGHPDSSGGCGSEGCPDDGLTCTVEECGAGGKCHTELVPGTCLIDGTCFDAGPASAQCLACDPGKDPHAFTSSIDGSPCDDGDACTVGDACTKGACHGGKPAPCDDGDACTDEWCDTVVGCSSDPSDCDDGDACTTDGCDSATGCTLAPLACNDGNICTADSCLEGECEHTPVAGPCNDGDACTTSDVCQSGSCLGEPVPCSDPPVAYCDGDTILVTYAWTGSCDPASRACEFVEVPLPCSSGCQDGACEGQSCDWVCDAPPSSWCVSADVLRSFAKGGACFNGSCVYPASDTVCPAGCEGAACKVPKGIVISEILYDSNGADTDTFVEIHAPAGTDLSGLTLYGVNGADGVPYGSILLKGKVPEDGLYVVAHPAATAVIAGVADLFDENVDYQNGPDSVVLALNGLAVDAVAYGSFFGAVTAGEGSPAPDAKGTSLARDSNYTDTNDNDTDFKVMEVPSPGLPNQAPI